ncbi:MAG TPA: CBS domain-containing protein [Luteimonas sp.]|nr:CBS domain-containing protein [Luteimonas sp.]
MDLNNVMTANPACCARDTPLQQVAQMMIDNDCGLIPVVDDQRKPLGVVTDRDIATRAVAGGKDTSACCAGDCMTTPVQTVGVDSSLADCCAAMESNQVRRVPVVDAQGRVCGIVSQADVALSGRDEKTAEVVKQVSQPSGA